ncbi:MAG TPA: hypothetical protein EYQ66_14135 [Myxococcales bacterium]|nr:hypothetical protein [Myxococcales bacterium]
MSVRERGGSPTVNCEKFAVMRTLALGVLLVFFAGLASKADQLQVELSPLASEPPSAVAVWELCFKSDVQLNRLTVGVIEPTDYTSVYSGTMAWKDCPGAGLTCTGTDYSTVDEADSFAQQVNETLFLVLGGHPDSGDLQGALAYPANWNDGLQCVARLLLSPGVPMTNPPALLSLSAADTASIDWSPLTPSMCEEPVVVDGNRENCDAGTGGSGLSTSFTDSVVVASSHPEDYDGDLVRDEDDNCVYAMNPLQTDSGGLKTTDDDGVGDVCQCGEGEGTGTIEVGDQDLNNMAMYLRGETVVAFDESRCSLANPSSCTIHDAALLDSALQSSATLSNVCTAFTP